MISEKVIRYAVREFEVALRRMSETGSPLHTFRLSDDPPASIVLMLAPTAMADSMCETLNKAVSAAVEGIRNLSQPN
jgi:hypothetical protein